MNRTIHYQISSPYESVYDFLAEKKYPRTMVSYIRSHKDSYFVNGQFQFLWQPLSPGDHLDITIQDSDVSNIKPVPMDLDIIYEDDDLLIINKPADLAIHPSMNHQEDTLANGVMAYYEKQGIPFCFRVVNRLDRDTSGLVMVTKNPLASAIMSTEIRDHSLQRTYRCVVEGDLATDRQMRQLPGVEINPEDLAQIEPQKSTAMETTANVPKDQISCGIIAAPIDRAEGSIMERCVNFETGQDALTRFWILDHANDHTLLSIQLGTGRTHQIRVHMNYIGHPLPGDYLYNKNYQHIDRQSLHSFSLSCIHPITGENMYWEAPIPEDMQRLMHPEAFPIKL